MQLFIFWILTFFQLLIGAHCLSMIIPTTNMEDYTEMVQMRFAMQGMCASAYTLYKKEQEYSTNRIVSFTAMGPERIPMGFGEVILRQEGGFINNHPSWYLRNLYVGEEYRSAGVATSLLSTIIDFVHASHCKSISLEVDKSNVSAQRLYLKLGFRNVWRGISFSGWKRMEL